MIRSTRPETQRSRAPCNSRSLPGLPRPARPRPERDMTTARSVERPWALAQPDSCSTNTSPTEASWTLPFFGRGMSNTGNDDGRISRTYLASSAGLSPDCKSSGRRPSRPASQARNVLRRGSVELCNASVVGQGRVRFHSRVCWRRRRSRMGDAGGGGKSMQDAVGLGGIKGSPFPSLLFASTGSTFPLAGVARALQRRAPQ
jgi:hypothetical protein